MMKGATQGKTVVSPPTIRVYNLASIVGHFYQIPEGNV